MVQDLVFGDYSVGRNRLERLSCSIVGLRRGLHSHHLLVLDSFLKSCPVYRTSARGLEFFDYVVELEGRVPGALAYEHRPPATIPDQASASQ